MGPPQGVDETAVHTVILAALCIYVVIGSIYALRCLCGKKRLSTSFHVNVVCLAMAGAYMYHTLGVLDELNGGDNAPFDPFEILGVGEYASTSAIKKAYRKASLKYHPDKIKPDMGMTVAQAEYKFGRIAKAYAALTDKRSKENYRRYGHPDGPQGYAVSVGLPLWMFDAENSMMMLIIYFIGVCILAPTAFFCCIRSSPGMDEVSSETKRKIVKSLKRNPNQSCHDLLLIIFGTDEMKAMVEPIYTCAEKGKKQKALAEAIAAIKKESQMAPFIANDVDPSLLLSIFSTAFVASARGSELGRTLTTVRMLVQKQLQILMQSCLKDGAAPPVCRAIESMQYVEQATMPPQKQALQAGSAQKRTPLGDDAVRSILGTAKTSSRLIVTSTTAATMETDFETDKEEALDGIRPGDFITIIAKLSWPKAAETAKDGDGGDDDDEEAESLAKKKAGWFMLVTNETPAMYNDSYGGGGGTEAIHFSCLGTTALKTSDTEVRAKIRCPNQPGDYTMRLVLKSRYYSGCDIFVPLNFTVDQVCVLLDKQAGNKHRSSTR
jgi:curved DNA-binding protein CbpA